MWIFRDARKIFGESPSGKAPDFDSGIRRFDPYLPSQFLLTLFGALRPLCYSGSQ